jgi:hypothetical protein
MSHVSWLNTIILREHLHSRLQDPKQHSIRIIPLKYPSTERLDTWMQEFRNRLEVAYEITFLFVYFYIASSQVRKPKSIFIQLSTYITAH